MVRDLRAPLVNEIPPDTPAGLRAVLEQLITAADLREGRLARESGSRFITETERDALETRIAALEEAEAEAAVERQAELSGLAPSRVETTDPSYGITFSAGFARADGETLMVLGESMSKRLDVAWAAGDGKGAMLGAERSAGATFHGFLIGTAGGTVDIGYSDSLTPTLPTGYSLYRRIHTLRLTSANVIRPFVAREVAGGGLLVSYRTAVTDVAAVNLSTTERTTQALTVPLGLKFEALLRAYISNAAAQAFAVLSGLDEETDQAAVAANASLAVVAAGIAAGAFQLPTDVVGRIGTRGDAANTPLTLSTYGYIDHRRLA